MKHTVLEDEFGELAAMYALGALGYDEARSFEEHLAEGCELCAAELKEFDAVVPYLALAAPEATPAPAVREKLIARVSEEARIEERAQTSTQEDSPAPAQTPSPHDFLIIRAHEGEWIETSDRGVFVKMLFADPKNATFTTLVRLEPGARVPMHRHRGAEQCLVLEGDLRSGGNVLNAGDYNCALQGTVHQELTTEQGALLLIVAPESYEVLEQDPNRQPSQL